MKVSKSIAHYKNLWIHDWRIVSRHLARVKHSPRSALDDFKWKPCIYKKKLSCFEIPALSHDKMKLDTPGHSDGFQKIHSLPSIRHSHSVQNLVNEWRLLHWFQSWLLDWVTFIATLPWIAILALSACIELVAWSARVTSIKSATTSLTSRHRDP